MVSEQFILRTAGLESTEHLGLSMFLHCICMYEQELRLINSISCSYMRKMAEHGLNYPSSSSINHQTPRMGDFPCVLNKIKEICMVALTETPGQTATLQNSCNHGKYSSSPNAQNFNSIIVEKRTKELEKHKFICPELPGKGYDQNLQVKEKERGIWYKTVS